MTQTINTAILDNLRPDADACGWVGFSGGLDSTVLLHWLRQARPVWPLKAVHVNHGLSPNADQWQQQCEQFCRELGVELHVVKVALDTAAGNLEALAREARYEAFTQVLGAGDVLLLAQHQDDQAETVLYRLLRGAGARGLAAMATERPLGAARLYRPLLEVSRAELEAYAKEHALSWVDDESNTDVRFDRNYLRHRVMPALRERWPAAARSLADSAELNRSNDTLLSEYAAADLQALAEQTVAMGFCLPVAALGAMSAPRRHNLLRYWLELRFNQLPTRKALAEIDSQLVQSEGHGAEVIAGPVSLQRFNQKLYALHLPLQWQPEQSQPAIEWGDTAQLLMLPGGDALTLTPVTGAGIAPKWLSAGLQVQWRVGGERCQPAGRVHSQSLKKLLQEYQIPTWLRPRVPLLYINGELAAVADYWVCQRFAATDGEPGRECCWQWPAEKL
ncbi:tRNA lysidine(34) synthetase TilS [Gilvimarinus japonicus]|uniref:tRNA(Ile)-lysidine synthase n=1 Tax=Gilvimarinus japonicus TaxID=1796469 RepID=A0ABV7HW60_9GAMM